MAGMTLRGSKPWRRGMMALAAAWIAVAVSSSRAAGEDAGPPAPRPSESPSTAAPSTSGVEDRRAIGRLPVNLGRAFIGVFNADNGVPFELGAVASAGVVALDKSVNEALGGPNDLSKAVETGGGGLYSTIVVGGMFTAGRFSHGRFRAMTYDMLDAALVNAAYTGILKVVTQRERPDGSDNKSFPSGHASNAFTLAAVAERHYGWALGAPAYAVAAFVGLERLQGNRHFPSDVVAGATLGYIVGRTVVRVNGGPGSPARHTTWNVSPITARGSRGALLTVAF
jgi:membrane-associated phospholipid phosphatase